MCYEGTPSGAMVVALQASVGESNMVVKFRLGGERQGAIRALIEGVPGPRRGGAVRVYIFHVVNKNLVRTKDFRTNGTLAGGQGWYKIARVAQVYPFHSGGFGFHAEVVV